MALAAYYLISIPAACLLVFKMGMGVEGLWIGMAFGISTQAALYTNLVLSMDWQIVAEEAEKRINE